MRKIKEFLERRKGKREVRQRMERREKGKWRECRWKYERRGEVRVGEKEERREDERKGRKGEMRKRWRKTKEVKEDKRWKIKRKDGWNGDSKEDNGG